MKRKLESIDEEFVTSAITIVECQIVLIRELGRDEAVKVPEKIEELDVEILPLSKEVLEISSDLLERYPKLNIFDSIHLAHAIHERERILSTDRLFDEVEGIVRVDPLR